MPRVAASPKELTVLFVLYTIVFYFRMYRDGKRYLADIPRQMKLNKKEEYTSSVQHKPFSSLAFKMTLCEHEFKIQLI